MMTTTDVVIGDEVLSQFGLVKYKFSIRFNLSEEKEIFQIEREDDLEMYFAADCA